METVSFSFVGMGLKICCAGRISKPEQIVRRSGWVPWYACSERNVRVSAHPLVGKDTNENNKKAFIANPRLFAPFLRSILKGREAISFEDRIVIASPRSNLILTFQLSAHPFAGEDASENNSNCLAILPRKLH